jgi:hypothetical protein
MLRFHSTRNWQAGGYCARRPLDRISLRRHEPDVVELRGA